MAKVDPPIKINVTRKVYFLPTRSPRRPNTIAPKGLTINPAANVAKVERKAAEGLVCGKNCSESITARLPKM
jgi:hypothetical protein